MKPATAIFFSICVICYTFIMYVVLTSPSNKIDYDIDVPKSYKTWSNDTLIGTYDTTNQILEIKEIK